MQIGILDDVCMCGTSLFVGHFSLSDDRLAGNGFGTAMAEGLRLLALGLRIERVFFSIRTKDQGQECFFLKLQARQLATANHSLTSTFC